jgi:hypothetical protein
MFRVVRRELTMANNDHTGCQGVLIRHVGVKEVGPSVLCNPTLRLHNPNSEVLQTHCTYTCSIAPLYSPMVECLDIVSTPCPDQLVALIVLHERPTSA